MMMITNSRELTLKSYRFSLCDNDMCGRANVIERNRRFILASSHLAPYRLNLLILGVDCSVCTPDTARASSLPTVILSNVHSTKRPPARLYVESCGNTSGPLAIALVA
ncbi:hypothetical protein L202_06971 [Cryptococcus amylolentus CBS 6039]|uniref:Uncharacterized protein n=1 Tax=Cryptococcus amylolentus CBS 6039 TaxID=1295533 RepID=A0A1E3HE50_9TREE|nr:hypothetical protein L202_06971 [Cryptococcus amylolentus CBS 6039]ODN74617.1 hypothetical protein L202_06971 [Cryptococcus amylolentus CBS 6039]